MDSIAADLAIQAILGRGSDFVGGIDNEALDFSQLEAFINSEGSQFGDTLNSSSSTDKLLNVIAENKRNNNGHSLPDSPPDSSSEHPYSPQDGCDQSINSSENIYATLGQTIYKPTLLNPIISDSIILNPHHIVVTEPNGDQQLIENGNILQHSTILVNDDIRNGESASAILNNRIISADSLTNEQNLLQGGGRLILSENDEDTRRIVLNGDGQDFNDRALYKSNDFDKNQLVHIAYNHNIDISMPRNDLDNSICESGIENIQSVYTNLQNAPKKRKLSQDTPLVKSEPEHCANGQLSPNTQLSSSLDDDYAPSEACLSESQYQCIRFNTFLQNQWHVLCDQNLTELPVPHYRVDADKGFNFSHADDAFVCQKKNHFQITCHVQLIGDAQFVKTPEGLQKISSFHIHFYGVKHDCPTQTIRVEQSQSDRSKKAFHPVLVELVNSQVTKVTVGRLHFSETTSNNMRKKGKPNPEQRYFQLVVGLHAHTSAGNFPIISHASQKIIVRASNPGQFESDVELCWQKGQTQDSVVHSGKVGINTDRPDESLVVHGNIKVTGHIIQPSDIRAKKNIVECDTATQLKNVQKIRVVRYDYDPTFASQLSRKSECSDTGVIAQEVAQILPEAVSPAGDLLLDNGKSIDNFLVVNKERIFMENIGAVKELCKVTDNLETRIDQLEKMNRRLNRLKRGDSLKSTSTVSSSKLSHLQKCVKHHKCLGDDTEELCSNKFIQIVIVILVLIMAFCLAAITTLYLIDTRRSQYAPSLESTHRLVKGNMKPSKTQSIRTSTSYYTTTDSMESFQMSSSVDNNVRKGPETIGRPSDCLNLDQYLENFNLCPIFCCASPPVEPPLEVTNSIFENKAPVFKNKSDALNQERSELVKPVHSNDIDKHARQKRSGEYDLVDDPNAYDITDTQPFSIVIQGNGFTSKLNDKYLEPSNIANNYSYSVPISKYMPDAFLKVIFRSKQSNNKVVAHCYNDFKRRLCPFSNHQKAQSKRKDAERKATNWEEIVFDVDMTNFQSKIMTYRAHSPVSNQNICKLTKSGKEFIEYNILFYRQCDE